MATGSLKKPAKTGKRKISKQPPKCMTVMELILALEEMPRGLEVASEGCDCEGDVVSLRVKSDGKNGWYLLLERSH